MLGEQATNHRATINEPLSLPVKLINCLLPTALYPTWGHKMDASAMQRLRSTEVNQKRVGVRGDGNAIRRHALAEIVGGLGGCWRKDLMRSDLRFG